MASAQHFFYIVFDVIDLSKADFKRVEDRLKRIAKMLNQEFTSVKQSFDMNALSLTFFGMSIQRFFTGIGRELFTTMQKLDGYNNGMLRATGHLQASWEFLKFSIINALSNPVFIEFIMNIINAVDATSEWVQQNEDVVSALAKISSALIAIGVLLSAGGQIKLGMDSLSKSWGNILTKIDKYGTLLAGLATVINIGLILTDTDVSVQDMINDVLVGGLIAFTSANPLFAIGATALFLALRFAMDKVGASKSLGEILGSLMGNWIIFADNVSKLLGNMIDIYMEKLKAMGEMMKAIVSFSAGNIFTGSKYFMNALDMFSKSKSNKDLFSGMDFGFNGAAFMLGYASSLVDTLGGTAGAQSYGIDQSWIDLARVSQDISRTTQEQAQYEEQISKSVLAQYEYKKMIMDMGSQWGYSNSELQDAYSIAPAR